MNNTFPYWTRQDKPLFQDLDWNIPEQKSGHVTIIGGNSQNFANVIKISEFLGNRFPIKTIKTILPDSLRNNLPPALPNITFLPSTPSGSFDRSPLLAEHLQDTDFIFLAGDLTKNSITAVALAETFKTILGEPDTTDLSAVFSKSSSQNSADHPKILVTRDSADLLIAESENLLLNGAIFVVSLVQLQKIFRAVYYPKVLMLSSPLIQIIETLHKFTLSYPATILTFHENQIIVAHGGKIVTTPLEQTTYSPITLWSGELASKVVAMNLWNPTQPLEATSAAIHK